MNTIHEYNPCLILYEYNQHVNFFKSNCHKLKATSTIVIVLVQYTDIMEIVVRVIIVLTVATVAAPSSSKPAKKGNLWVVDPQYYEPTTNGSPVFSDTTPHVALTHIFCGQIKQKEAQGFHSRHLVGKNSANNKPCAKTIGKINSYNPKKCPFSTGGIEVLDTNNKYKSRKAKEKRPQTFFPDDWNPPFIVKLAQRIYKHCSELENGKACLKDYKFPDSDVCPQKTMNIKIDIQDGNIISAYPIFKLNGCNRTCTFQHDDL